MDITNNEMTIKKETNTPLVANLLFFTVVLLSLSANIFVSLISTNGIKIHIIANLLVSQMIIILPGLAFFLYVNRDKTEKINMYKKIKPVTVLLMVVFTFLMLPLVTAANFFSQIFTRNAVVDISGQVLDIPFLPMVFIMGLFGPFCEEFVFRGLIYSWLSKKSERYIASALVSALFFGLMHMNFNQFCYAFVLGFVFAIVNEALDSTWPSFICHAVVNTENVAILYISDKIFSAISQESISDIYNDSVMGSNTPYMKIVIIIMFIGALFLSVATTTLAALLFYGICKLEGKTDRLKKIFKKDDNEVKKSLVYPVGIVAITICIFVMFLLEPLINLIKSVVL